VCAHLNNKRTMPHDSHITTASRGSIVTADPKNRFAGLRSEAFFGISTILLILLCLVCFRRRGKLLLPSAKESEVEDG